MTLETVAKHIPTAILHEFEESKKKGEAGATQLDNLFKDRYIIVNTPRIVDMLGVDRIFEDRKTGHKLTVEYKTDYAAAKSERCFIEMEVGALKGWFFTCLSQIIVIHVPHLKQAIWLDFLQFKRQLLKELRCSTYQVKRVANHGFEGRGVVVPIDDLKSWGKFYFLD